MVSFRKNAHAIYRVFFSSKNGKVDWKKFDIFNIFAQNIDCGYEEAVLTSTHNLCFGSKNKKTGIPLRTPVLP